MEVTPGLYTSTGPRCMIRMMDGMRMGRCLDSDSLDAQPGGLVHVFPCTKRWNQFHSFGNGRDVPRMAIHTNVPLHTRNRIAETGRVQEPYMVRVAKDSTVANKMLPNPNCFSALV